MASADQRRGSQGGAVVGLLRAPSFNPELGWEFCEDYWNSQFSECRSACLAVEILSIDEGWYWPRRIGPAPLPTVPRSDRMFRQCVAS